MAIEKVKLVTFGPISVPEVKYETIGEGVVAFYNKIGYEEIFDMIQEVINRAIDDRPFVSAPLFEIVKQMVFIEHFTNIDMSWLESDAFGVKDFYENYDILSGHGVIKMAYEFCDKEQYDFYDRTLRDTVTNIMKYRNSAVGIVDMITSRAKNLNKETEQAIHAFEGEDLEKINQMVKIAEALDFSKS